MGLTRAYRGRVLGAALALGIPTFAPPARPETAQVARTAGTAIELLALDGFDPVSYFLEGGPFPGSARYELSWGGRVWRFRGAADRAAFREAPAVYTPRLGGHDAAGILDGRLVEADPLAFAVIDGRLYLFRDAARRARFLADPGLARRAEAAWPVLRGLMDVPPPDDAP